MYMPMPLAPCPKVATQKLAIHDWSCSDLPILQHYCALLDGVQAQHGTLGGRASELNSQWEYIMDKYMYIYMDVLMYIYIYILYNINMYAQL